MKIMTKKSIRPVVLAGMLVSGLVLAACGEQAGAPAGAGPAASDGQVREEHGADEVGREVDGPRPRLAFTREGGITVVDAEDGEVLTEVELPGFLRLSHAGDGRHVMVSAEGGFRTLDLGAWTHAHGDHGHSFVVDPQLRETTFPARVPGHVVAHGDETLLFDDGTGQVTAFDPHHLADGDVRSDTRPTGGAHHGVAVRRVDGSLLHTLGTEEGRTGIVVLGADGEEVARNEDCPGVHGEAVVQDEVVAFGCEDGLLLVDGEEITKVASPDAYGRMGNLFGSPASPVLLGDYKSDPDAELERPTRISLVDTRTGELELLDLGTSYSFRSLGRGPNGEALVLGTDGALRIISAAAGKVVAAVPVVDAWEEPLDWHDPRPTLAVVGDTAWVSEPATRQLHAVDLVAGAVVATLDLAEVPNELVGVTG